MKKLILLLYILTLFANLSAQDAIESLKKSEFITIKIDEAVYSETTSKAFLKNGNLLVGGFIYEKDKVRRSVVFLNDGEGNSIKNGYGDNFLSYYLYQKNDNFVVDIAAANDGGAYVLGSSDYSNYSTGYLSKFNSESEIIESFMLPNSEDTGFVRIHVYNMVFPNTFNKFQSINDTTYCEPKKCLIQNDGKILIVGCVRKQMESENYQDGESFVMRLFANGKLDSTYGIHGISHINLSEKCDDVRTAILDEDGNVILYGLYNHDYKSDIISDFKQSYVVKVNQDGHLDNSFGNKGVFIFEMPKTVSNPVEIIQQETGDYLFFSNKKTKEDENIENYEYGLTIFKLKKNGILDTHFFNNGVQLINKMGIAFSNDIIKTDDGKILICGTNQNLIKHNLIEEGDEILIESKEQKTSINYTNEELNQESAVGFCLRLNEDCTLDKSFPKNGCFFTSKTDLRLKIYFSKIIPTSKNHYVILGASNSDSSKDGIYFLKIFVVSSLDFGNLLSTQEPNFTFYPNPVKTNATLDFSVNATTNISASLLDMNGKIVQLFFENKTVDTGSYKENITINNTLPKGIYVVILKGSKFSKSIKIIVE